jgi:nicotinamidase-related amidase
MNLDPARTAVVTQELQGAVVGPEAGLRALADEARRRALPNIERLLPVARRAGVQVIHCLVQRRPDGRGANTLSLLAEITTTDTLVAAWQ